MKLRPHYFAIVAALIGAGWYFLLFAPIRMQSATNQAELDTTTSELQTLMATLRGVPDQLKNERGLDSLRNQLNNSLYAPSEIERLFNEFTDEASSYNLEVTEITPAVEELLTLYGQKPNSDIAPFLNFSVRMTGRFTDFGQFMERLEEAPFFQGVNRVTINSNPDPNQGLMFFVDMRALLQETGKQS